jgi:hypothetical protein
LHLHKLILITLSFILERHYVLLVFLFYKHVRRYGLHEPSQQRVDTH